MPFILMIYFCRSKSADRNLHTEPYVNCMSTSLNYGLVEYRIRAAVSCNYPTRRGDSEMQKGSMGMMIASKRKELGMTQMELAEKMGVTDKAVSKWERDLSYPDISSLPKLAEILGVSVDELMQVKHSSDNRKPRQSVRDIVSLVLKAICLAMGVAVAALSILGQISTQSAVVMLGIGLGCAGISLLENSRE